MSPSIPRLLAFALCLSSVGVVPSVLAAGRTSSSSPASTSSHPQQTTNNKPHHQRLITRGPCGTKSPAKGQLQADADAINALGMFETVTASGMFERAGERGRSLSEIPAGNSTAKLPSSIDVYFHVINGGNGTSSDITEADVKRQMDVLNKDYAAAGVSFKLADLDFSSEAAWQVVADDDDPNAQAMKKALHKGTAQNLNVYATGLTQRLLGYATFPSDYAKSPELDGVVISKDTMPKAAGNGGGGGGNATTPATTQNNKGNRKNLHPGRPRKRSTAAAQRSGNNAANDESSIEGQFDLGRTLVHETGHFLGLYHTFQDGCTAENDGVADTPAQESASSGCPKDQDTCTGPGFDGKDDVTNFMDYSDDGCMDHFTPGQIARMGQMWAAFRAEKPGNGTAVAASRKSGRTVTVV